MIPVNSDGIVTFTNIFGIIKTEKPTYFSKGGKSIPVPKFVDEVYEFSRYEDEYGLGASNVATKTFAVFNRIKNCGC